MIYLLLFWEFFKVGLFSFGGGMATIPFLYKIADKYHWFDKDLIINMIGVAESTPGPVGVNMATYAGYQVAGVIGGIISTFSLVIPSLIIVIIVTKVFDRFRENKYFKEIMSCLHPVVIGFVIAIFLDVLQIGLFYKNNQGVNYLDFKFIVLFMFLLFIISKKNVNIILYFILAGTIGFCIGFINILV